MPGPPRTPRNAGSSRVGRALQRTFDGAVLSTVVLVAYASVFHLSVVRGTSMEPGIHDGDRILVEPWSYLLDPVRRGDVVVLRSPVDPDVDYIKRVVGLPGEELVLTADGVWVDGVRIDEPYAISDAEPTQLRVTVPEGHFFVLGDNRPRSADSRDFGVVRAEDLRGRVDLRVWPPKRIGSID